MNESIQGLINLIPDSAFRIFGPLLGVLFALGIAMAFKKRTRSFGVALFMSCGIAAAAGYAFMHGGAAFFTTAPADVPADPAQALAQAVGVGLQPMRMAYVVSAFTFLACAILFVATGRLFSQTDPEEET